jgi:N-acetylneuraminate lyase
MEHLRGLIAATHTALHADGSLNLDTIERQFQSLVASGANGAFVAGTTGESVSLTTQERMQIAERWCIVAGGHMPVIVHVGDNSLPRCQELARHAQGVGADAIACMAPSFFKPESVQDLVSFCAEVASAAPRLPFYFYHTPGMTGVDLPMVEFLSVASPHIPNLAGVKFTSSNLDDLQECLLLGNGRFDVLLGLDDLLLDGLVLGVRGAVGTNYNIAVPLYRAIIDAHENGDHHAARRLQVRAVELEAILCTHSWLPASKAVMRMVGVDCGPMRLPLRSLTRAEYDQLFLELVHFGFFSFCSRRD